MVFRHNLSSADPEQEEVVRERPQLVVTTGQDHCQPCQGTQYRHRWQQPLQAGSPQAALSHCSLRCSL